MDVGNISLMKKLFSAFVALAFLVMPVLQVSAISPEEINQILQKKRDPHLQSILKAHKRAIAKRNTLQTTKVEGGLWRSTLSKTKSSTRVRPGYTSDSFRNTEVRTPKMLKKSDRRRTGITQRRIDQPRLWSRRQIENQHLRVRKFRRGGDAYKQNIRTPKTSITEQRERYLKRKRYEYNPLDSE